MIERRQTTTCEVPAAAVFTIPDVSLDNPPGQRESRERSVVTRVVGQRLSSTGKTIVLLGVFLFYAMIGVMGAKVVIWVCGTPGEEANIVENSPNASDAVEPLGVATRPRPLDGQSLTRHATIDNRERNEQQDPAISSQFRQHLMDSEVNNHGTGTGNYSRRTLMTALPSRKKSR